VRPLSGPTKQIVDGLTWANLPLYVCPLPRNAANAWIVLDEGGAESLYGKGGLLREFGMARCVRKGFTFRRWSRYVCRARRRGAMRHAG
jgi:hypothetical protein